MHTIIQKAMNFIGWSISSFFLFTGFVGLFSTQIAIAILVIIWGLIFFPPLYQRITKSYGLKKNIIGRIIIFFISPIFISPWIPISEKSSLSKTTVRQTNTDQIKSSATQKKVFVSPEYKMFRAAGASPEQAQILKDSCISSKTCPTKLDIAKAVVRGEMSLGLVSRPDQPCTETEFKNDQESGDFCYYKSAEGRRVTKEVNDRVAASKVEQSKSEIWKNATVLSESQPNNKKLAAEAEKARLELIVENGTKAGISRAEALCRSTIRFDENYLAIEDCDSKGNKIPMKD